MNTLKKFLDNEAGDLLQNEDLVVLVGGREEDALKDVNALSDCKTTNNCDGGNCAAQCGGSCSVEQPTQELN